MILLSYLYHSVITLVLFNSISQFSFEKYENHKFYFFQDHLDKIGSASLLIFAILFLSLLFNLLIFVVNNSISRLLAQTFSLMYFLSLFSSIKIHHNNHAIIYVIIVFCFFNYKSTLNDIYNRLVLRSGQASLLSIYFCSGLWKARMCLGSDNTYDFYNQVLNQYAYSIAEGGRSFFPNINLDVFSLLFFGGYLLVIIFQLSSIGIIFFQRWIRYYGLFVVLFHIGTGILMDIWFANAMIAGFLLLTLAEIYLDFEERFNENKLV